MTEIWKFILGILGAIISGLFLFIWKEKRRNKKVKELADKKSEEKRQAELKIILDTIKELSTEITLIHTSLGKVNKYLDNIDKKNEIKRIIKKDAAAIIKHNPDLKEDKNFSGMITLLTAGRNYTIELGCDIFFSNTEDITIATLRDDIYSIFDELKLIANVNIGKDFSKSLRKDTGIKILIETLILNLWDIKNGKYNGNSFNQLKTSLLMFLEAMYNQSISYWRKYKKESHVETN